MTPEELRLQRSHPAIESVARVVAGEEAAKTLIDYRIRLRRYAFEQAKAAGYSEYEAHGVAFMELQHIFGGGGVKP